MQEQDSTDEKEVRARITEGLPWVEVVARYVSRNFGQRLTMAELQSHGEIGLLKAARQFDPQKNPSFRAFAKTIIERAMIDGCREHTSRRLYEARAGVGRVRGGDAAAAADDSGRRLEKQVAGITAAQISRVVGQLATDTEGEGIALSPKTSAEEAASRAQLNRRLLSALERLPANQAFAVRRHFFEDATIDQVAAELEMTRMQARYLLRQAEAALRKALGGAMTL